MHRAKPRRKAVGEARAQAPTARQPWTLRSAGGSASSSDLSGSYFLDIFLFFFEKSEFRILLVASTQGPVCPLLGKRENQTHSISLASVKTKYELLISHYPAFMGNL